MKLTFENLELIPMGQAAESLGISRMTLHRWIVDGKILAVQVGAIRAIPRSEIERLNYAKPTD